MHEPFADEPAGQYDPSFGHAKIVVVLGQYEPAGQFALDVVPAGQYLPRAHVVFVVAVTEQYEPAGQTAASTEPAGQ